jgi:phosphatidylserine/phosphatidylglycerophosphate/cardiolipin synthase-like enzyme
VTKEREAIDATAMEVHFGGPDRPTGALAQLLRSRIETVPAGGQIHWITYYFGNQSLARSLLEASKRGVTVKVDIDANPRRARVNAKVAHMLGGPDGVGDGFRRLRHAVPCHVHEKLYFFSHPRPTVFAGSYNPSRNDDDTPELLRDIGDQDRGHNFLVEIADPGAVSFLISHMEHMHGAGHGFFERFSGEMNRVFNSADLSIYFFPRRRSAVHLDLLRRLPLSHIRIAASHFRDRSVAALLANLAGRGVAIEILAHETLRRVPARVNRLLTAHGIRFRRYRHEEALPMHNKFMLLEGADHRSVLFGSFNFTRTSRWLNHEVLMLSENSELFDAFEQRFENMMAEVAALSIRQAPTLDTGRS